VVEDETPTVVEIEEEEEEEGVGGEAEAVAEVIRAIGMLAVALATPTTITSQSPSSIHVPTLRGMDFALVVIHAHLRTWSSYMRSLMLHLQNKTSNSSSQTMDSTIITVTTIPTKSIPSRL